MYCFCYTSVIHNLEKRHECLKLNITVAMKKESKMTESNAFWLEEEEDNWFPIDSS